MEACLAVDFGSTYTKIALLDLRTYEVKATAKAASTVGSDVNIGLENALRALGLANAEIDALPAIASSSAAGGLRAAVVGLVPDLSLEAARRAALGAGAKIIRAFGYKLTPGDIVQLESDAPEILLLVGGTDGGDEAVVTHNAALLAKSKLASLFIAAGNRVAMPSVDTTLRAGGKDVVVAENLLPTIDAVNAEPVRNLMRDVFMTRIIHAKGIDRAQRRFLKGIIPTPAAVLRGAELLAGGTRVEPGFGELMVVDVGGATTDVHSIGSGDPTTPNVILKGLPEPYAKRTVEGDLGLRINAPTILERAGIEAIARTLPSGETNAGAIADFAHAAHADPSLVPRTPAEQWADCALARSAVHAAALRHAGSHQRVFSAGKEATVQRGKDLRQLQSVIGVGGIFAFGIAPEFILEGVRATPEAAEALLPAEPRMYVDREYILYAIGLLADLEPDAAVRIAKKSIAPAGATRIAP
ncbi:MAG TPA: methylaspartate mutase accessory protein GlmL [Candidatus Acidoferrales bacterium]|nr:methylaspartate mutase accessory protein GlmL [Candidatus Acidoferrales bacterium]